MNRFVEWFAGVHDRRPVLFLHSLGTDHRLWQYQQEAVEGRTYGWMDARGHGASQEHCPVSVELWVEDIREVIEQTARKDVVLCGISMGGVQALAFANKYPHLVGGLILADTFLRIPLHEQEAKIAGTAGKAAELGMDRYADEYLDATLTKSDSAMAIRPHLRQAISGMSLAMYVASARACFTADVSPVFSGIPTLVLIGEHDFKTPRERADEIVASIPDARLQVIPNAAHLSNVDNPAAFNRAIQSFLEGVDEQ
ncbi:MAG: alpha/beta hydrolase [Alicyclobacillus macrosporangiidus]|uniref:alpha/beta fold hydrolase n=1 Tax=Alicyclobacillus macrosporangiidus TaxID=392015 RepID=UPI0026F2F1F0|nr:alpha/beta fold hydrolase [Alicyclobacillus macrosporangiidus]MCL6598909.1 alpha/beta hydrolase [Alicyclobacillus macrosporangiidus]